MALIPIDSTHALQIQAGTIGRKAGHAFEDTIAQRINTFTYPFNPYVLNNGHVFSGDPAALLLTYISKNEGIRIIRHATAISTGSLATSEDGKKFLSLNGSRIYRCKSDLIITIEISDGISISIGVSTKQCNNNTPTNAQLYFTTARGFANLLHTYGMNVSETAIIALRQFCGDPGFCPLDNHEELKNRHIDNRRYFWEEIDPTGRSEWEQIFITRQDDVSRLLFQKAYLNDPFTPEYLLHKTKKSPSWNNTEVAIYSIDELITLSREHKGFSTKQYSVKKGSQKDPEGISHLAPRFGIIQMQRGGQKQHPEQLQFNLEAGYFYKI